MPRSKKGPTLLEVIEREKKDAPGRFEAPPWWKSRPPALRAEPETSHASDEPASPASTEPAPSALSARNLLTFFANPTHAVVALGALAIVTLTVVQVARLRDPARPDADLLAAADVPTIDQLRQQPPAPDALDVLMGRTQPAAPQSPSRNAPNNPTAGNTELPARKAASSEKAPISGTTASASTDRRPGLNYVIVETFRGDQARKDAHRARRFLQERAVPATIEKIGNRWRLVTLRGFNSGNPDLKEYCRSIEALGREYFAAGGRYRFKGCYGKLFSAKGW